MKNYIIQKSYLWKSSFKSSYFTFSHTTSVILTLNNEDMSFVKTKNVNAIIRWGAVKRTKISKCCHKDGISWSQTRLLNPYTLFTTSFWIIKLSKEGRSQTITRLIIYVTTTCFQFSTVLLLSGSVTSGVCTSQQST